MYTGYTGEAGVQYLLIGLKNAWKLSTVIGKMQLGVNEQYAPYDKCQVYVCSLPCCRQTSAKVNSIKINQPATSARRAEA